MLIGILALIGALGSAAITLAVIFLLCWGAVTWRPRHRRWWRL